MNSAALLCPRPKCRAPLPASALNQPEFAPCPACGAELQVEAFPALIRPPATGHAGEFVTLERESTCFYHPQKKAILACTGCGRYVCALCDCELQGVHYCPLCLETGKSKGKIKNLENQRTLYDSIALTLAILPPLTIVGIYFTFITAPIALCLSLRHWNTPRSFVHRTKVRFIFAILISILQIAGWVLIVFSLYYTYSNRHE